MRKLYKTYDYRLVRSFENDRNYLALLDIAVIPINRDYDQRIKSTFRSIWLGNQTPWCAMLSDFINISLERRWSIHSFRYGCLVTTSSLSPAPPLSLLWYRTFGCCRLSWRDGRWVQDPGTYSPGHGWFPITSDSGFMESSCRLQSELGPAFWDWLHLAISQPSVPAIVARVSPRASKGHADLTSSPPSSQTSIH